MEKLGDNKSRKETYCNGGIGAEELGDKLDFFG
jgi:hypothetical protein